MVALLPVVAVPASPGMLVVLIAVVEIGALGASPPLARGIVVGLPTPAHIPASALCGFRRPT